MNQNVINGTSNIDAVPAAVTTAKHPTFTQNYAEVKPRAGEETSSGRAGPLEPQKSNCTVDSDPIRATDKQEPAEYDAEPNFPQTKTETQKCHYENLAVGHLHGTGASIHKNQQTETSFCPEHVGENEAGYAKLIEKKMNLPSPYALGVPGKKEAKELQSNISIQRSSSSLFASTGPPLTEDGLPVAARESPVVSDSALLSVDGLSKNIHQPLDNTKSNCEKEK